MDTVVDRQRDSKVMGTSTQGTNEWSLKRCVSVYNRMSCQDFRDNFFGLFICNQVPISLDHGSMLHERWSQMTFKDHLIPGNTEGSYDSNYSTR